MFSKKYTQEDLDAAVARARWETANKIMTETYEKRRVGASPIDTLRQNQEALEQEQQRLRELIGGYEGDQDKPGFIGGYRICNKHGPYSEPSCQKC